MYSKNRNITIVTIDSITNILNIGCTITDENKNKENI